MLKNVTRAFVIKTKNLITAYTSGSHLKVSLFYEETITGSTVPWTCLKCLLDVKHHCQLPKGFIFWSHWLLILLWSHWLLISLEILPQHVSISIKEKHQLCSLKCTMIRASYGSLIFCAATYWSWQI